MKNRPEEVDARLQAIIDAWRGARERASAISDEHVRPVAEKIADGLRDEQLREALAPLFKNGKKKKK
jgi:hypothetical protein